MEQLDAEDARSRLDGIVAACAPHWKQSDRAKESARLQEIVEKVRWIRERAGDAKDRALAPWRRFRSWFKSQGFKGGVRFNS